MAVDKGYSLGDIKESNINAFLTEQPEFVAIEFKLHYLATDVLIPESENLTDAILVVEGNCGTNIKTYEILDVEIDEIKMLSGNGERIPTYGMGFARCNSLFLGRQTIPYRLKVSLTDLGLQEVA